MQSNTLHCVWIVHIVDCMTTLWDMHRDVCWILNFWWCRASLRRECVIRSLVFCFGHSSIMDRISELWVLHNILLMILEFCQIEFHMWQEFVIEYPEFIFAWSYIIDCMLVLWAMWRIPCWILRCCSLRSHCWRDVIHQDLHGKYWELLLGHRDHGGNESREYVEQELHKYQRGSKRSRYKSFSPTGGRQTSRIVHEHEGRMNVRENRRW